MGSHANTISGAVTAGLMMFISAIVALFMNDPNLTLGAIKQAAWISMGGSALLQAWKDYEAISFRRLANKVTNTGDGGGLVLKKKTEE